MGTTGITKPNNGEVNYTFNGWYTASSNGTKVASNSTTPALEASVSGYTNASKQWTKTSGATLYAGWTQDSTTLATLGKTGNSCSWKDSSGNTYASGKTGFTTSSNITLTANCTVNQYVLTVNPNGGSWNNSTSASTVTQNYGTIYTVANPTRTGYTFTGWTLSGKGSISGTTYTYADGAGTLTANWKIDTHTLTIKPNGGSYNDKTTDTTVTQNYNSTYGLTTPTKTGYAFSNWTLNDGAKGTLMRGNASAAPVSGSFTKTIKTDTDGSQYTNYTLNSTNSSTSSYTWPSFKFPNYAYISGHKYRISVMIRVRQVSGLGYLTLRHSAMDNDWGSTGMISKGISINSNWVEYTLDRTFTGTTIMKSGTEYTINPCVEVYSQINPGNTGIVDMDMKNLTVYDVTAGTYISSNSYGGYVYKYGTTNDTVTANYKINQYVLTVNPNGGTWNNSTSASTVTQNYGTTYTVANPTRTGYTFTGWTLSGKGSISGTTYTYADGAGTLTANWKANTYTVTYDANGGTGTMANDSATYDSNFITTKNAFARTGYTFNGWNEKADGTGTVWGLTTSGVYESGKSWKWTYTKNITLYAQWTLNTYTITYNLNGGTVSKANPTSYNVTTATFTLNNPSKTGYTFTGWTGSNGTTAQTSVSIAKGSTGNKSYTANWKANTNTAYKVVHQQMGLDGSTYTTVATENLTGTTGASITPAVKSYTGFTSPSTQTTTIAANGSTVVTYKYTRNKYAYTLGSGTAVSTSGSTASGSYYYGSTITLKATVSAGYTWSKWTSSNTGLVANQTTANTTFTMPAGAITMTPSATLNTYTITYNLNGGTVSTANPTSYNVTTATFTLNNPSKTGHTFTGWTGSNGTTAQTSVSIAKGSTGNKSYTANYSINQYYYDVNPDSGIKSFDITVDSKTSSGLTDYYQKLNYGKEATITNVVAKSGYTYTGYSVSGSMSVLTGSTNSNIKTKLGAGNGAIALTSKVNNYTVTYDSTTNGGSTATQTATVSYGSKVDLTKTSSKSGYTFVGWNTNKDATSALSSYSMPAGNVTLYAIYSKTLTATFNYYNSKSETKSVTIYNKATSGSITSPAALGTPSGYTFRHYSTSNAANASKTVDANSAVVLTSNQTYYASYQKTVTLNFYYHSGTDIYANTQTSTTASGIQYLGYNNVIINSTVSIPSAVTGSTGYYGTSYKGVTASNSTTPISVNTGTTNYYAYYQATITYYYYNGSAHTTGTGTRTAYSNGTNYVTTASTAPTPSAYDGAAYKGWSYTNNSVNARTPTTTAMTALYAYYQKTVTATFNYYDGSKAASTTAGNTRTYISKSGGVNTLNTNITIPDAAKANRSSYTYRGVSTSNAANASVVTPTTANTTYYSSYSYSIAISFNANGGTGTAPSSVTGTGYMNYNASKVGISATLPANPFSKTGYAYKGWNTNTAGTGTTYNASTQYTFTSSLTLYAKWEANNYTITLNNNGASTAGTSAIYQRYATGIYLDSAGSDTKIMSSTSNPISVPSKPTYRIHYKNKEVSTAEFSPKFNGYFTASSSGTQLINSSGYITSNFTNTYFSSNATLYARWDHNYTLSTISQTGYTCSWNTKFDGTGTKYNSGATASITANTTLYAICTANSYTVKFEPNGGSVATTSKSVTFDSDYGTLPTPTRADSTDSKTGKTISYAFEGWYTAANGGTKVTDTSLVSTASDHSLYAHWISKPIITGGSADWFNKEVNIALEVPSTSDTGSVKYQYYVSTSNSSQVGGEWKDTSESGYAPVTTDGIHYVFYRAISSAGVYSNVSNFQTVKIDTQGPINLTVNNPKNNVWSTSDVTVTLSATDTSSGVKEFQWYENDAWTTRALTTSGNSATITFGAERNTTIRFRAVDNVGNASSEVTTIVKIDKTTPTAPVLTGGSASWTTACGTISIQTAGTTGPSGIKNYEAEIENMLNGGSIPASYNQMSYKDNGNWQTTGTDPYMRFDDLGNVYMTYARVSFASATPVAMKLQVFYWTEGSGPTETNSSTVDVPAGTKGYVDVQIKAGTYDGIRFDFGSTANVTYQLQFYGYVNKFTKPTLNSDGTYNYSTTVCNRGLNRVRYRTVANNNLVSNWSNYDTNDGSKVLIDNPAVYDVNTSLKYSTVQKAVNLLKGKGGAYLALLRDTVENVTIPSGTDYPIELGNHYIHGYIKNYGTVALGNGYVTGYYVNQNNAFINYGTAYINGNVTIMGGDTAIISSGGAINISGTNNTIRGIKGYAINMDAGTITVNSGTTVYSDTTITVSVYAGTFNLNGGTVNGPSGNAIASYANGTINILSGNVNSTNNSGIYSRGALTISGGKISTNKAGKNGVYVESGTAKMTDGEVFNVIDDNNCSGALTLASTSTNGFIMTGGYIHGCVGINYQSGATGKIYITINNSNASITTNITGKHTGINIYSTVDNVLNIGSSGSTSYFPMIASSGDYYGVDLHDSSRKFVLYSGHIRSGSKSAVFRGTNAGSCPSGTRFQKAAGSGYYDAWCH